MDLLRIREHCKMHESQQAPTCFKNNSLAAQHSLPLSNLPLKGVTQHFRTYTTGNTWMLLVHQAGLVLFIQV